MLIHKSEGAMLDNTNRNHEKLTPIALEFGFKDLFKVFWEILLAYRRSFFITPGLYYTGNEYDVSAPLLVTANYHLTVWSVWRRIKHLMTRILVIDTDGINVWCSAGKGNFSSEEITRQLERYPRELLSAESDLQLILPKLSLSGVKLSDLKKHGIRPIIGPIYARDLPDFLQQETYQDCEAAYFRFDLNDRLFTLLSSWRQVVYYNLLGLIGLGVLNIWLKTGLWWQIMPVGLTIATIYILFFPYLPTRSFAWKGSSLGLLGGLGYGFYSILVRKGLWETLFYLCFMAGFSIFFGLYYTGNSGVSNHTTVKKETVQFLPVVALLLAAATIAAILKGVIG